MQRCIADWSRDQELPAKFYYACDLFEQDVSMITVDEVLAQFFTELRNLSQLKDKDQFISELNSITQNKCIIGYCFKTINDYYRILGVLRSATNREIKDAYHKLAKKLHPDKNSSLEAEKQFKELKKKLFLV